MFKKLKDKFNLYKILNKKIEENREYLEFQKQIISDIRQLKNRELRKIDNNNKIKYNLTNILKEEGISKKINDLISTDTDLKICIFKILDDDGWIKTPLVYKCISFKTIQEFFDKFNKVINDIYNNNTNLIIEYRKEIKEHCFSEECRIFCIDEINNLDSANPEICFHGWEIIPLINFQFIKPL